MSQRFTDITLSLLASVAAFLLSWPFWRDFADWSESPLAWRVYFALGFLLAVYVFYVFISSLHMLFLHGKEEAAGATTSSANPADSKGERA